MLFAFPEYAEVKSVFAIDHNLVNIPLQHHPGDTLEGILKNTFALLHRGKMTVK
jgi:hypothetical protein